MADLVVSQGPVPVVPVVPVVVPVVVWAVVVGQSARSPPPPGGQKVKYVPPLQLTTEQKLKDWTAVTIE
jgi:hypothetical protein